MTLKSLVRQIVRNHTWAMYYKKQTKGEICYKRKWRSKYFYKTTKGKASHQVKQESKNNTYVPSKKHTAMKRMLYITSTNKPTKNPNKGLGLDTNNNCRFIGSKLS